MTKALGQTSLLTLLGDLLNESISGTSFHTTAKAIRAANNAGLAFIGQEYPVREEVWVIPGDGSTTEWAYPNTVLGIETVDVGGRWYERVNLRNGLFRPTRGVLLRHPGYGYYTRPRRLGVVPAPASGVDVTVHCRAMPGAFRATVVSGSGGTRVATFTNESRTVTMTTGTLTEGTDIDVGDSVTTPDGDVYVVESITSTTVYKLSEPYRGATATLSTSWHIGRDTGLDQRWNNALAYLTAAELMRHEEDQRAGAWSAYGEELARKAAESLAYGAESKYSRGQV